MTMTIADLAKMSPEESERWITSASDQALLETLALEIRREVDDMDSGDLRDALRDALVDGPRGYGEYTWSEAVKEVHELVEEARKEGQT